MEGNRFEVYQDPITKTDYEGIATVILENNRNEGDLVSCMVIFDKEDTEYHRWIDKNDEIIG